MAYNMQLPIYDDFILDESMDENFYPIDANVKIKVTVPNYATNPDISQGFVVYFSQMGEGNATMVPQKPDIIQSLGGVLRTDGYGGKCEIILLQKAPGPGLPNIWAWAGNTGGPATITNK
jgi:hypothetical protein